MFLADSAHTSINDNIIRNTVNQVSSAPEHSSKKRYPSHLSMVWLNIFFYNAAYALKQQHLSGTLKHSSKQDTHHICLNIFFYNAALALKQQ